MWFLLKKQQNAEMAKTKPIQKDNVENRLLHISIYKHLFFFILKIKKKCYFSMCNNGYIYIGFRFIFIGAATPQNNLVLLKPIFKKLDNPPKLIVCTLTHFCNKRPQLLAKNCKPSYNTI